MQAEESVCGQHLNNIETTCPRLRPQVQRELSGKHHKVKNAGERSDGVLFDWHSVVMFCTNLCGGRPHSVSASVGAQEGEAHTEVPYRAGFYGDLRKAVTRSGSFSGLISVLPQRRTCVQPPTFVPSPLNPTSMTGHRQPIKPGLGGYLHTLGCSEKVFEHAQSRPAPFTNFFSSFFSVSHCFHLSLYFTSSHLYILPLPCPYRVLILGALHTMWRPEITHFVGAVQHIPNAPCSPPPLYPGSAAFCCYDNDVLHHNDRAVHVDESISVNSRSILA